MDNDQTPDTVGAAAETPPVEVRYLLEEWAVLGDLLSGLAAADWEVPTALPGWTVRDVVAHVAGTEHLLAGDPVPEIDLPDPTPEHVRNPIGELNERFVQQARSLTVEQALADVRAITDRRAGQLTAMSPGEFEAETDSPVGRVPYRRFMGVRVFDCWVHEDDIRQALGMPHRLGGEIGRFAVDEIVRALPRIVGRNAGAPDGSRVRFRVTGPAGTGLPLSTDVLVAGRAGLVDVDDSARTTVELVFDTSTFVRAATGRTVARPGHGVEVGGDEALARAILESMAFTI